MLAPKTEPKADAEYLTIVIFQRNRYARHNEHPFLPDHPTKYAGSFAVVDAANNGCTGCFTRLKLLSHTTTPYSITSDTFHPMMEQVLGPASADMRMFPLESDEEASSFPLTKWKIPEPPEELVLSREDGTFAGDIDVVIVPAMAVDSRCNRLGHGKGYYGKRATESRLAVRSSHD